MELVGFGATWTRSTTTEPTKAQKSVIHALAAGPLAGHHVFLVAGENHLYRSSDGGQTFKKLLDGTNNRTGFVRAARHELLSNAVYYGDGTRLHRTTFMAPVQGVAPPR